MEPAVEGLRNASVIINLCAAMSMSAVTSAVKSTACMSSITVFDRNRFFPIARAEARRSLVCRLRHRSLLVFHISSAERARRADRILAMLPKDVLLILVGRHGNRISPGDAAYYWRLGLSDESCCRAATHERISLYMNAANVTACHPTGGKPKCRARKPWLCTRLWRHRSVQCRAGEGRETAMWCR